MKKYIMVTIFATSSNISILLDTVCYELTEHKMVLK